MAKYLNHWVWVVPLLGWLLLPVAGAMPAALLGLALIGSVLAAVHHAEVVAHRVGEPFGTLILAVAVTIIEVGLIVTLMSAADAGAATLARDTVFAAVMIILGGLVGACLLVGGIAHGEQHFQQTGVSASLACVSALTVLTLVLPNYTVTTPGPVYSDSQLALVAVVSFLLYMTFVAVQTVRHRDYFLAHAGAAVADAYAYADAHAPPPSDRTALISGALLLACLGIVVLLAKTLAKTIEAGVVAIGAPHATVGVIIAALVLLPESVAAIRAARANRLQTSLNLALGSAIASIALTIPAVAAVSLAMSLPISLGLDAKSTVLLLLSLIVSTQSLATGRTTILQGVVHLTIFAVYLFTTIVP